MYKKVLKNITLDLSGHIFPNNNRIRQIEIDEVTINATIENKSIKRIFFFHYVIR